MITPPIEDLEVAFTIPPYLQVSLRVHSLAWVMGERETSQAGFRDIMTKRMRFRILIGQLSALKSFTTTELRPR